MNIVLIISSAFPYGQAFSSRARNFVKLFDDCGYHVHVIAPISDEQKTCKELDKVDYSVEYVSASSSIMTFCGIGTSTPYMNALIEYGKKNKIDLIVSSSMTFVSEKIRKYAHNKRIPYVMEQCEWYDRTTFKFGIMNPYYREHIRQIRFLNKKCNGIIAISRLFEEYYLAQKVKVIRIPTILDVYNDKVTIPDNKKIELVFAGSLGKGKEKIKPILQALCEIGDLKNYFHFNIYGPDYKSVLSNIGNDACLLESLKEIITIHGKVPQEKMLSIIKDADYSIFIRPNRRSSNAGFPTKLAESMSVGTPVITNNTGDISLYLNHGKNGFLVERGTSCELKNVFINILANSPEQNLAIRKNAKKTAIDNFCYKGYREKMKNFIEEVIG